jgi:hypothetical protein
MLKHKLHGGLSLITNASAFRQMTPSSRPDKLPKNQVFFTSISDDFLNHFMDKMPLRQVMTVGILLCRVKKFLLLAVKFPGSYKLLWL